MVIFNQNEITIYLLIICRLLYTLWRQFIKLNHQFLHIIIFTTKMIESTRNMLYIQQSNSLNTTRMIPVSTLTEALQKMMGLYVQIKFQMQKGEEVMFDIQEAIDYFQKLYEMRYLQEMDEKQQPQRHFCSFQMKTMKILNKHNLLDEFVDHYSNMQTDNPEASNE